MHHDRHANDDNHALGLVMTRRTAVGMKNKLRGFGEPSVSQKHSCRIFLLKTVCRQPAVFATDDVTAFVFLMVKVASLSQHSSSGRPS